MSGKFLNYRGAGWGQFPILMFVANERGYKGRHMNTNHETNSINDKGGVLFLC